MSNKQTVQVEGRTVQLSNLDKVLWPKLGLTKADLLDYHVRLSPFTVTHWQERAITVTRYPHGVDKDFFYQKNIPVGAPNWVETRLVGETEFVLPNNLSVITWLINLAAIEFHPSTFYGFAPEVPTYAVIDLDPTEPCGLSETVQVAKRCRDLLQELDLRGYPKFSGVSGIHIYIPLLPKYNFEVSSELVRVLGVKLQKAYPQEVTLQRLIKNRQGIYVDYLQNHPSKTIVGAYSPRPTPEATVSTPVDWDDLDYFQPQDFTIKTVPDWVKEKGDLFEEVITQPQSLAHLLKFFSQTKN